MPKKTISKKLKNPEGISFILIVTGLLFMVIDGTHYGVNVGNLGFLFALTGVLFFALLFVGSK